MKGLINWRSALFLFTILSFLIFLPSNSSRAQTCPPVEAVDFNGFDGSDYHYDWDIPGFFGPVSPINVVDFNVEVRDIINGNITWSNPNCLPPIAIPKAAFPATSAGPFQIRFFSNCDDGSTSVMFPIDVIEAEFVYDGCLDFENSGGAIQVKVYDVPNFIGTPGTEAFVKNTYKWFVQEMADNGWSAHGLEGPYSAYLKAECACDFVSYAKDIVQSNGTPIPQPVGDPDNLQKFPSCQDVLGYYAFENGVNTCGVTNTAYEKAFFVSHFLDNPWLVHQFNGVCGSGGPTKPRQKSINSTSNNLQIFPNPVKNQVTIDLRLNHEQNKAEQVQLVIYDQSGMEVFKQVQLVDGQLWLDLTELPNGIYRVAVSNSKDILAVESLVKL